MQDIADTETRDYTSYARCFVASRLAINGYAFCGVVGTLKCEGVTAGKDVADSCGQCTYQFVCPHCMRLGIYSVFYRNLHTWI
jgi:hypothetical protein